jgi:CRP-like cAMP-binding protein
VPREERARLAAAGRMRSWPRGAVVLEQGSPATEALVLLSGRLRSRFVVGDQEQGADHVGVGDILGELALFGPERRRSARVEASTDATALTVDRATLQRLSGTAVRAALEGELIRLIARRLRSTDASLAQARRTVTGSGELGVVVGAREPLEAGLAAAVLAGQPGAQRARIAAGATLWRQGEAAGELLLLREGRARVSVAPISGALVRATHVIGPALIGLVGVADAGPRTATVIAETDLVVDRLPLRVVQLRCARADAEGEGLRGLLLGAMVDQLDQLSAEVRRVLFHR